MRRDGDERGVRRPLLPQDDTTASLGSYGTGGSNPIVMPNGARDWDKIQMFIALFLIATAAVGFLIWLYFLEYCQNEDPSKHARFLVMPMLKSMTCSSSRALVDQSPCEFEAWSQAQWLESIQRYEALHYPLFAGDWADLQRIRMGGDIMLLIGYLMAHMEDFIHAPNDPQRCLRVFDKLWLIVVTASVGDQQTMKLNQALMPHHLEVVPFGNDTHHALGAWPDNPAFTHLLETPRPWDCEVSMSFFAPPCQLPSNISQPLLEQVMTLAYGASESYRSYRITVWAVFIAVILTGALGCCLGFNPWSSRCKIARYIGAGSEAPAASGAEASAAPVAAAAPTVG